MERGFRAILKRLLVLSRIAKPKLFLVLAPLLLIASCTPLGGSSLVPVYMSYEVLRASVAVEDPRSMSEMGRFVVYQDHLFVNELNKGLHVIDNSDPRTPEAIGFINIPGNTDVSIRDGYLYADSFIDLVVIDIRDPAQVVEVNRITDLFPWNQYQVVGADEWFNADDSRGVVIAVNRR